MVKRICAFLFGLSLTLILCACSLSDKIPSLEEIVENGAEWGNEQLQQAQGCTLADLEKVWGKADGELSGMYGYFWKVSDTVSVNVYYYKNAEIEHISVSDWKDGNNADGAKTTFSEQPNYHIVNIVDRTKTEGLPYDMAEEKFFEDGDNEYYFSGIYSHYVIVHYEDGSQEDIVTALNAGRATIADLDKFDVSYKAKSLGVETAKPDNGTAENVPSFSYEEVNQIYKENDPGVKCDGFYNTTESEVTSLQQAIDRAKNECTIKYDTIDVFYDNVADIWKVVFSTAGTLGGCQTVYLDNKGLTCLVIYGE